MIRDVTHAMRVTGMPRTVACLVLDVDTGLVRGLAPAETVREACAGAVRTALTQPADTLPSAPPGEVLCPPGQADEITAELYRQLGDAAPAVIEVISVEAEDIFDSFIGHMAGRRPPTNFATPPDWQLLMDVADEFRVSEPWRRWSDADHLDVLLKIERVAARYVAVVMGQAGIQRGLVLYPGGVIPASLRDWEPGTPAPVASGTVLFFLDPPTECPPEAVAKAARYGWPGGADVVPQWVTRGPDGPRDLDRCDVQRVTVALRAVLAHDRHANPRGVDAKMTGTFVLAAGEECTFTIG